MKQRTFALQYSCPYCKAAAGDPCIGKRKGRPIRLAMHQERHDLAFKAYKLWLGTP